MTILDPIHRDHNEAAACRRLWASVMLAALSDWWAAIEKGGDRNSVRAEALRYFRSRDGKTVAALAGISADPEKLADIAADPSAKGRTVQTETHKPSSQHGKGR